MNYINKIDLIFIDINFNIFIDFKFNIIIIFYINNIFITKSFNVDIQRIKNIFNIKFKINNLNFYNYYLNIIIIRDRINRIFYLK